GTVLKEPQLSDLIELLTFLLTTDSNNFAGIFEVRQIMEEASAGLAARRATDNDIKRIQKELEAMHVQKEVVNLTKADLKFHYAIAVATKNNVLVKIMNLISDLIENFMLNARRRQFANPEVAENYMRQHMAIFEAIARRDEKYASLLMREHLYYAWEQFCLFKALAEEERNQQ
ncbi:MAG: FadR/GntR family transcriptional regulator, partial [Desulfotomaculales bacterium]